MTSARHNYIFLFVSDCTKILVRMATPERATFQPPTGATCRICYLGSEDGSLFTPCHCSGTMKFVHRKCLEKWRASGPANARFECPQCRYHYGLVRPTKLSACVDRRWVVSLITLVVFFLIWAVCNLLSYHAISFGLITLANTSSVVGIWTMQNMQNSLVVIGMGGLVYSLLVDGVSILFIYNVNPLSCHGLFNVCILVGVARTIAAIYSAVSSWVSADGDELMHYVLDICDSSGRVQNSGT